MNIMLNRLSMLPAFNSSKPEPGRISRMSRMSNEDEGTLVSLRKAQINECKDTVSFSGLINR